MTRKPASDSARSWNNLGMDKMNRHAPSRARQIVKQRSFIYERQQPTCLSCGGPRENRAGLKCNFCLKGAA